jgi:hypothetical protein
MKESDSNYSVPFKDGYLARKLKKTFDSNPYDSDTQNFSHQEWCRGWSERHTLEDWYGHNYKDEFNYPVGVENV